MSDSTCAQTFNHIKTFANIYKDNIARENNDYNIRKTFYVAGNDLYDTLNDSFDSLFLKCNEIDVSNDIIHEFLNMCKEESFSDIMEELSRNVGNDLNSKLKGKLHAFITNKNNNKYTCNLNDKLSCPTINDEKSFLENLEITKNSENSNGIDIIKNDIDNYDEKGNLTIDNYTLCSTSNNILTDDEITEKIDELISNDLNRIENLELDVIKIVNKVKELSETFSFTLNIMSKIVVKVSLSAYYNFITYPKQWNELKEKLQIMAKRMFAFIINKNAILLLYNQFSKKIKRSVKQVILLPHPKTFLANNVSYIVDNSKRIINLPVTNDYDNKDITLENDKSYILNLCDLEVELNESSSSEKHIANNYGKTYYFENKNILISVIKDMPISSFKFVGHIDISELCIETKKHLKEFKMRRSTLAEQILGVSQKNIYTILTPRRGWGNLSIDGQELYIRLRAYLDCFEDIKSNLYNMEIEQKNINNMCEFKICENQLNNQNNIEEHLDNNIFETTSNTLKKSENNTLINIINIERMVNEIKKILFQNKINLETFTSTYVSCDKRIIEKIIFNPKECDLSSVEFNKCYLELKRFLQNQNTIKPNTNNKEFFLKDTEQIKKSSEKINNQNKRKFIFVPVKENFCNLSNKNLKRNLSEIENNLNDTKRLKVNKNVFNQTPHLQPYENFSNEKNLFNNNKAFPNFYFTPNDFNNRYLKVNINNNFTKSPSSIRSDNISNNPFTSTTSNNTSIMINHINNYNSHLPSIENSYIFHNDPIFNSFYKKIMSTDYLYNVSLKQIEILCLAWTYNPNPIKILSNYIGELTMLSNQTIETFYQKTNRLQDSIRYFQNNEIFRNSIRRCIIEYTTRKAFIIITSKFFEQLFNDNLIS
uniref:CUT domain-containing protein n=1 Tax=Strongyloides stercoralis TaxID=6248 RepID=A0A0K0EC48_STRER